MLYAEALTEYSDDINGRVYTFINAVRERASLEGVIESWEKYSNNPDKPKNKAGLLDIIHRERLIELAFEGQRFGICVVGRHWKNMLIAHLEGGTLMGQMLRNIIKFVRF